MPKIQGSGTVTKKCDCPVKTKCAHGWTLRYWLDGKQREKTFRDQIDPATGKVRPGSGKKLAEDFALKLATGKREGDTTFADKAKAAIPFAEYCLEWIESPGRTESTRVVYRSALRRIRADLGSKTLAQVAGDREFAQALIDAAPASHKRRTRILIVSPCNEALKSGRLGTHRLRGLRVEDDNRPAEFYDASGDQLGMLARELGAFGLLVYTGRLCGLRIGESLGLNISDFREEGTVLRLTRTRLADGTTGPLKARKAGQYRDIPVSPKLWQLVSQHGLQANGDLFPAIWQSYVHKMIREARDACGLPGKWTAHDLRHSYASHMLAGAIPISDVAKYLGHESIEITFRTYGHLVPASFGRARSVIDESW
jgi:integrase